VAPPADPAREADPAGGDVASARRVLGLEAQALTALAGALDSGFARALDLLAGAAAGRVIVTGMGKSGHVARKIAATLASTGTPAQYVHPGEASHGDLGMITRADAVLALSNSGETAELGDLVAHAKRFDIRLVAITARAGSALAQAADATLLLPAVAEACPMGLAPTTSTTMMLALGDALAVALLERRGFTREDFHVLHPGGRLGKRLLRVVDIMHGGDELPLAPLGASMREAILVMTAKTWGCVGVVDRAGRLVGVITDGDIRRHIAEALLDRQVEQIMNQAPKTIRPGALAAEALGVMNARKVTQLFVVDAERPVGLVRMHDVLRAGVA